MCVLCVSGDQGVCAEHQVFCVTRSRHEFEASVTDPTLLTSAGGVASHRKKASSLMPGSASHDHGSKGNTVVYRCSDVLVIKKVTFVVDIDCTKDRNGGTFTE